MVWWPLSSTTDNIEVLSEPEFLGETGERTIFTIEAKSARKIQNYSAIKKENEVLLLPGTPFKVKSILQQGDLTMVHLEEDTTVPPMIDSGGDDYEMMSPELFYDLVADQPTVYKATWISPDGTLENPVHVPVVLYLKTIANTPTLYIDHAESKLGIHEFPVTLLRGYGQREGRFQIETGRRCTGGVATYKFMVGKIDVVAAIKMFMAEWKANDEVAGTSPNSTGDGNVPCPICRRLFPVRAIHNHVEWCLLEGNRRASEDTGGGGGGDARAAAAKQNGQPQQLC